MPTIPHAYHRGAIYWYRRVLHLFAQRKIVVRLSLRTAGAAQARMRSSVLSGATAGIQVMIETRLKNAKHLGAKELEAIGKELYEQTLAGIQTAERRDPTGLNILMPTWRGLHDLVQLVIANGGRPVNVEAHEDELRTRWGYNDAMFSNICNVAALTANGEGIVNEFRTDPLINDHGYQVDETNRAAVRLAALPHVADAYRFGAEGSSLCATVSAPLMEASSHGPSFERPHVPNASTVPPVMIAQPAAVTAPSSSAVTAPTLQQAPGVALTIREAAENCVASRVASGAWRSDTASQVRTAVDLFVFITGDILTTDIRQHHFGALSRLFAKLPKSWGRTADELKRGLVATMERAKDMPAEKIGIHIKTQRKHYTWLTSVLEYAAAMGNPPAEAITTKPLAKGKDKTPEHEKRVAWTDEEILILNSASVWTGSLSIKKRFVPGKLVWHDGCYFIPLMLELTGFRSSEAAGLSLAEVHENHVVPYIHLRATELRGLKGDHASRMVPIAPELIRLGFIDYVKALRVDGETLVFPEMYYPANKDGFDSSFYKIVFSKWRASQFSKGALYVDEDGVTRNKNAHGLRGSFATYVEASDKIRNMIMGHAGKSQSDSRYDQRMDLPNMLNALESVSRFTKHLERKPLLLLPKSQRQPGGRVSKN